MGRLAESFVRSASFSVPLRVVLKRLVPFEPGLGGAAGQCRPFKSAASAIRAFVQAGLDDLDRAGSVPIGLLTAVNASCNRRRDERASVRHRKGQEAVQSATVVVVVVH